MTWSALPRREGRGPLPRQQRATLGRDETDREGGGASLRHPGLLGETRETGPTSALFGTPLGGQEMGGYARSMPAA